MKVWGEIRRLPPRRIGAVALSHLALLGATLWGGLPYVALQLLLAFELLLLNIASIPLYPHRGWLQHAFDTLKLAAGLAFVLFFVLVTYGIAAEGDSGYAGLAAWQALRGTAPSELLWAALYLVVHITAALVLAIRSARPRVTWAKNQLAEAGATFVALFLMVFVAAFVGRPLVAGLAVLNVAVDVDLLLGALMVVLRFLLSLVVATFSDVEMEAMAANPYLK
jgi:hypothetical protein